MPGRAGGKTVKVGKAHCSLNVRDHLRTFLNIQNQFSHSKNNASILPQLSNSIFHERFSLFLAHAK